MFQFQNTYARLPKQFHRRLPPTPVAAPELVRFNTVLGRDLGLDVEAVDEDRTAAILSGNEVPQGSVPIAMAYGGHQFGNWVPQLGDGRAILLGEVVAPSGRRFDVQLKGAGPTPFSRMGDGRAALGSVLREYLVSEAMASLGIPTTRALSVVTTGEPVFREAPLTGAVLTRVASSHVRVGTFQFFAARKDIASLRTLADYVIERHDPSAAASDHPYRAMLDGIVSRQASLVAAWMGVGFIHGVMNTDNTAVSGETIDYGPCAFMDTYHPDTVYSSIDHAGRYAYGNQPRIAHWNLGRMAEAILPILADDQQEALEAAQAAVDAFPDRYQAAWMAVMRRKLGLVDERDGDEDLVYVLLDAMAEGRADFTLAFRRLAEAPAEPASADDGASIRALFSTPDGIDAWLVRWRERLAGQACDDEARRALQRAANPAFIPRNHRVEEVLRAAEREGDFGPFDELLAVLEQPFDDQPGRAAWMAPPRPEEEVRQTFCGT